jgi:hypothetical protein
MQQQGQQQISDVRATNAAAGVQILTWLARRGVVGMQGS